MNLFTLSLEQRTCTNIAIALWSQDSVRDLISKSALGFEIEILYDNWIGIEKNVIEKSFKLQLPQTLKDKLLEFIIRVGLQIFSWIKFHHCDYKFVTELPATFVWTSLGAINNMKTAKLLVMGGNLGSNAGFALACLYCLEDEIKHFQNIFNLSLCAIKLNCPHLVSYWSDYMNKLDKSLSSNSDPSPRLLYESAGSGNEVATRYFFQRLNMEEDFFQKIVIKDNFAVILARYVLKLNTFDKIIYLERHSGVMLFLLSMMNVEEQAEIFANHTYEVLLCLIIWPWQNLFMEMIKGKWNFLSRKLYYQLLQDMVDVMMIRGCYLNTFFREFWQQSPEAYKQYVIKNCDFLPIVLHLYQIGDVKNAKLILKDSNSSLMEIIIYKMDTILKLFFSENWNSVEFLIQECISSKEDLIRFRDECKTYLAQTRRPYFIPQQQQWDKFFQLVEVWILRYTEE